MGRRSCSSTGCDEAHSYEVILWWSVEDDAYVAEVPELPGCLAHGSDRAEALAQAEQAIALWVRTAEEMASRFPCPAGG